MGPILTEIMRNFVSRVDEEYPSVDFAMTSRDVFHIKFRGLGRLIAHTC
jgi:hypothetical protein